MRYGPLADEGGFVTIGATTDLHLRLSVEGLTHARGEEVLRTWAWAEVESVSLRLPGSRFPYPGAAFKAGMLAVTFAAQETFAVESGTSIAELTAVGGDMHPLTIDHHLGGYWRPAVVTAERLVGQFVTHPERRYLLAHPHEVLARYVRAVRWHRRL